MMANAVIILILIVVLLFALNGTIKHFKGEGACCGGGSGSGKRPRMKKGKKAVGPGDWEKDSSDKGNALQKLRAECNRGNQ